MKKVCRLYKNGDIEKLSKNRHFIEKQVTEITEMNEMERTQKAELKEKQQRAKTEMGSIKWTRQFIKENFQYAFTALVNYHQGKRIENKAQVLVECLTEIGEVESEKVILSNESDDLLYYLS